MPITFNCACGQVLQFADEIASGNCPACGAAIAIPGYAEHGCCSGRAAARRDTYIVEDLPPQSPQRSASQDWSNPRRDRELPEPIPDIRQLLNHVGQPISKSDDLFAKAPAEIGQLYSASTTLKKSKTPISLTVRLVVFWLVFAVSFVPTFLACRSIASFQPDLSALLCMGSVAAAISAFFASYCFWRMRFRHTCTYVGVDGVAAFVCTGHRKNVKKTVHFLFRDATELRIAETRLYTNHAYTHTDYRFTWTNEAGKTAHWLGGRYKNESGNPEATDYYHFAVMAETAWTMHLLREIDNALAKDGWIRFGLKGGNYVQLGSGGIILLLGYKTVQLPAQKIKKIKIFEGVISIWEVGGKEGWITNQGIHKIMYHDLSNARFFLFALEKLLGFKV